MQRHGGPGPGKGPASRPQHRDAGSRRGTIVCEHTFDLSRAGRDSDGVVSAPEKGEPVTIRIGWLRRASVRDHVRGTIETGGGCYGGTVVTRNARRAPLGD